MPDAVIAPGSDADANFGPAVDAAFDSPDSPAAVEDAPEPDSAPEPEPGSDEEQAAEEELVENAEEPEPAAEPESAPEAEEGVAGEELPEGVSVRDKDGKKIYSLKESRYRVFEAANRTVRELENVIGEPVTPEAIHARNRAFIGQEQMHTDFLSADPAAHQKFINHWIEESNIAVRNGDVMSDPMVAFTSSLVDTLATQHPQAHQQILLKAVENIDKYPEAHDRLLAKSARQILDDIYQVASETGNEDLWRSAQHIDNKLFKTYYKTTDQIPKNKQVDPLAAREARVAEREQSIRTSDATRAAEQWQAWRVSTNANVKTAVADQVKVALQSEQKAYAKFPLTFKSITDQLNSLVREGIKKDAAWQDRTDTLLQQAQMTVSERKRQELAAQLIERYTNKAKQIVDANKDPVIREANRLLKAQSTANHERRTEAAKHREPGSGGTPVRKSLVPEASNGAMSGAEYMAKDLDRLLG